jgi:uncharacterized protein YoaH (UPF0181 family)
MTTKKAPVEEIVELGACGVAVGAQVDVAAALRFDRDQQLKADEQSDARKLQEARDVVARLGDDD